MKLIYFILSLFLLSGVKQANSQALVFNKAIEDKFLLSTKVFDDSSFLAAFDCDSMHNIIIARIKNDGSLMWSKELDDTLTTCVDDFNGQYSVGLNFFVIPSTKNIILQFSSRYCSLMSGTCHGSSTIIKTDSLLNPLWVKRAQDFSIGDLIEIDAGHYACRGHILEDDGFRIPMIILMDSSGSLSNGKMFGWPPVWSMVKTINNKIAVLYNWKNPMFTTWDDIELTIYDSLLNPQWSQCFGTTQQDLYYANLLQDANGNFYIIGCREANSGFFITKTDSAGNSLWYKPYTGRYLLNSCLVNDTSVFLQFYPNTFAITNSLGDIVSAKHISNDSTAEIIISLCYFEQSHQLIQFYSRLNTNSQNVNFMAGFDSVFNAACPLLNDTLTADTFSLVPCQTASATTFSLAYVPYPVPLINDTAYLNFVDTCNAILMSDNENQSEELGANELKLYPNPVVSEFKIQYDGQPIERIEIFNGVGQKVYSAARDCKLCLVDCSSFQPGFYFIKATVDSKIILFHKFVKE